MARQTTKEFDALKQKISSILFLALMNLKQPFYASDYAMGVVRLHHGKCWAAKLAYIFTPFSPLSSFCHLISSHYHYIFIMLAPCAMAPS